MEPLAKDKRHPADYRDEIEHAEVAAALSELPGDHPAAVAYWTAAVGDSLALTYLLKDRADVAQRLVAAYLGDSRRIWSRQTGGAHLAGKL
ncbi:MAG TPA: hypothetical protein VFB63_00865 [Bryobacteraceae bacterium]|jgi:hypothetical protein|nr:hypothetical protein [Bryobacteraceae bacterium]